MARNSTSDGTTLLITGTLVPVTLLTYLLEVVGDGQAVCEAYGLVPARLLATGEPLPLLTSLFLHDPAAVAHVGLNMAFLVVFGAVVEPLLGSLRFLALYIAAGVLGGLTHVLVDPTATAPLVGASGAVFGVMAVAGVLRPPLLGFAVAFGGLEVWNAFSGGVEGVSFGCHIGGLVAGALFAALWRCSGCRSPEAA